MNCRYVAMDSNTINALQQNQFLIMKALKEAQKEETVKINRIGRRERRAGRERKMRPLNSGIPSYAKTETTEQNERNKQEDESSESNNDIPEKITYITSFGNEELKPDKKYHTRRPLYSEKLKENLDTLKKRKKYSRRYSSTSSSSSTSDSDYYRRRYSTKSRSTSTSPRKHSSRPQTSTRHSPREYNNNLIIFNFYFKRKKQNLEINRERVTYVKRDFHANNLSRT